MVDTIPPRERPEWVEMAKGQHKMEKFVLQLQIDRISKKLNSGDTSERDAVDELYGYFEKYPKGFQSDLTQIFKSW
ncbi:hypothetical protein ACH42_11610 [Endozoicomonas sp. (ex Bugula neritina AB1)]|nr:hypothetical protein ACH42_11610 [Endozoicomonas sp. (ex Bugula neritina AB1)]